MRVVTVAVLCAALTLVFGCSEPEPEPVIEEPPPPTPEEIFTEINRTLRLDAPIPPPGTSLPPGAGQEFLAQIQSAKAKHNATEEGKEALRRVARRIEDRMRGHEQNELWDFVLASIDAYEILVPGSAKYARLRQTAEIELRKPRVTLKGLPDFGGTTTAMIDLFLPLTGERITGERMRLGEQKFGIRFKEVIGNNRGARFIYLETQEEFDVFARE